MNPGQTNHVQTISWMSPSQSPILWGTNVELAGVHLLPVPSVLTALDKEDSSPLFRARGNEVSG